MTKHYFVATRIQTAVLEIAVPTDGHLENVIKAVDPDKIVWNGMSGVILRRCAEGDIENCEVINMISVIEGDHEH